MCSKTFLVVAIMAVLLAVASSSSVRLFNVTEGDRDANLTFKLPNCSPSQAFLELEVTFMEERLVEVTKVYQLDSKRIQISQQEDEFFCAVRLHLVGLIPITKYQACFDFKGSNSDNSKICEEVKTNLIFVPTDDSVKINWEGVALIAFVGVFLVFALMLCVFYERVISSWVAGCAKRAASATSNARNKWEDRNSKKKDQAKKEGESGRGGNKEEEAKAMPVNGYTRPLQPALPPRSGTNITQTGDVGGSSGGPSASSLDFHDSNRTLNERIIREALENRPKLMRSMDEAAASVREKRNSFDLKRQLTFEEHYRRQGGRFFAGGRDNFGFDDREERFARRMDDDWGSLHHRENRQQQQSQGTPQYSNDYRRVYRNETDHYMHEREMMKRQQQQQQYGRY